MLIGIARPLIIAAAGLWLAGCYDLLQLFELVWAKDPRR